MFIPESRVVGCRLSFPYYKSQKVMCFDGISNFSSQNYDRKSRLLQVMGPKFF